MPLTQLFAYKKIITNYKNDDLINKSLNVRGTRNEFYKQPITYNKYGTKTIKYQINKYLNIISKKLKNINELTISNFKKDLKRFMMDDLETAKQN